MSKSWFLYSSFLKLSGKQIVSPINENKIVKDNEKLETIVDSSSSNLNIEEEKTILSLTDHNNHMDNIYENETLSMEEKVDKESKINDEFNSIFQFPEMEKLKMEIIDWKKKYENEKQQRQESDAKVIELKVRFEKSAKFENSTKLLLAIRVKFFCSMCGFNTMSVDLLNPEENAENNGEAAHICSGKEKGPRNNPKMTLEQIKSPLNGIHLCRNCHGPVDKDSQKHLYPASALAKIKFLAEQDVKDNFLHTPLSERKHRSDTILEQCKEEKKSFIDDLENKEESNIKHSQDNKEDLEDEEESKDCKKSVDDNDCKRESKIKSNSKTIYTLEQIEEHINPFIEGDAPIELKKKLSEFELGIEFFQSIRDKDKEMTKKSVTSILEEPLVPLSPILKWVLMAKYTNLYPNISHCDVAENVRIIYDDKCGKTSTLTAYISTAKIISKEPFYLFFCVLIGYPRIIPGNAKIKYDELKPKLINLFLEQASSKYSLADIDALKF